MVEHLLASHGATALKVQLAAAGVLAADTDAPLPAYVANFLVTLRLGTGVPFLYLVPDQALLPDESIRFFTVDEGWLDQLMDGALAVGAASSRDTEHVRAVAPALRAAVRDAVPLAAGLRRRTVSHADIGQHIVNSTMAFATGLLAFDPGGTPPITGFLLRSGLVSGWPGLSIRAFTTTAIADGTDPSTVPADQCVPILRMEQLAPSVLIVLFAGTPQLVWIEEPHHGIQLGVDGSDAGEVVTPVNPDGTEITPLPAPVLVPMRAGAVPKVIDIGSLATLLAVNGAADLAVQLLRPPYRERFAADQV